MHTTYTVVLLQMAKRLLQRCGKHRRDDDEGDGNDAVSKRHKPDEDVKKAVERALARINQLDQLAAKWKTNLNRWQLDCDPIFEANRLLASTFFTCPTAHCTLKWNPGEPAQSGIVPYDPAAINEIPSVAGFVGNVHFLLSPPLECIMGRIYVTHLFTAMKFGSNNCVSLINEYYAPACCFDVFVVSDDNKMGQPARRLYLRERTGSRKEEEEDNASDALHARMMPLYGFVNLITNVTMNYLLPVGTF